MATVYGYGLRVFCVGGLGGSVSMRKWKIFKLQLSVIAGC
jgi:hypothetical protein